MSADNFVGVRPNKDGTYSIFEYGNMSVYGEDCMYLSTEMGIIAPTREHAIMQAHDIVNEMYVCEYGVVEMPPVPDKLCGGCCYCVYERCEPSADLPKCDKCNKVISNTEWQVMTQGKHYHNRCEPNRGL